MTSPASRTGPAPLRVQLHGWEDCPHLTGNVGERAQVRSLRLHRYEWLGQRVRVISSNKPIAVFLPRLSLVPALLLACFGGLCRTQAQACAPVGPALVAWWPGDGSADGFLGVNNATLNDGATFATGKVGKAFTFDGEDDYLVVPDSVTLRAATFSVEGWFRVRRPPTGADGNSDEFLLVSKYRDSRGWNLRLTKDLRPGFQVYNESGAVANATADFKVDVGSWVHLAASFDGTNAILYVNGTLQATSSSVAGYTPSEVPLTIGTASWMTGFFLPGEVDELAIYSRSLMADEVRAIVEAGGSGKCRSPAIGSQPIAQIITPGASATFSVTANGEPPLRYQWYFNATNTLAAETNATLTLPMPSSASAGEYSVEVSNLFGVVRSMSALLTIANPGIDDDGDGVGNSEELRLGLEPSKPDTDGDGITDFDELFRWGTDPLKSDSDEDGMPDLWEVSHGLDARLNDAGDDLDFDRLSNLEEYERRSFGSLPEHAQPSGEEQRSQFYYDKNDRLVGAEYSAGIAIAYTYDGNDNLIRQTVMSRTAEARALPALWSFLNGLTNGTPLQIKFDDPDGDGWSNWQEWKAGTLPSDSSSLPGRSGNPGTNVASLSPGFPISNFVVATGQLDSGGWDELVLGADGEPNSHRNYLLLASRQPTGWSTERVDVGAFGITSIAVGKPLNRPVPAVYVGLRGGVGGAGQVLEFTKSGGLWTSNLVALSTNRDAFVLGVREQDVVMSLGTTNAPEGSLSTALFEGSWSTQRFDTNVSHRGLGTTLKLKSGHLAAGRVLDTGEIQFLEAGDGVSGLPRAGSSSWYALTKADLEWAEAQAIAKRYGGNLVTIDDQDENEWVRRQFPSDFWIGLYREPTASHTKLTSWKWISGATSAYRSWAMGEPNNSPDDQNREGKEYYADYRSGSSGWSDSPSSYRKAGLIEFEMNNHLFVAPSPTSTAIWRGNVLASGSLSGTHGVSLFYGFMEDLNRSGTIDFADDFVVAEQRLNSANQSWHTVLRRPIGTRTFAGSYGLASANFLNGTNDVLFTGEPDGQVAAWTGSDGNRDLQRHSFSTHHVGAAWHALTAVGTHETGDALAGLRVDLARPIRCDLVIWPPEPRLPSLEAPRQTAPAATILPPEGVLGNLASLTVRLWDSEGNAATPYVQYQAAGATQWTYARLKTLWPLILAASPSGTSHTLVWDALSDLGPNLSTDVLLRVRAADMGLVGDWSRGTLVRVQTEIDEDSEPDGMPDSWERAWFGSLGRDGASDFDGDGLTDRQEYQAGTDPTSGADALMFQSIEIDSDGSLAIKFQATLGRSYTLQVTDSLEASVWRKVAEVPPQAASGPVLIRDAGMRGTVGFYRLVTPAIP